MEDLSLVSSTHLKNLGSVVCTEIPAPGVRDRRVSGACRPVVLAESTSSGFSFKNRMEGDGSVGKGACLKSLAT